MAASHKTCSICNEPATGYGNLTGTQVPERYCEIHGMKAMQDWVITRFIKDKRR